MPTATPAEQTPNTNAQTSTPEASTPKPDHVLGGLMASILGLEPEKKPDAKAPEPEKKVEEATKAPEPEKKVEEAPKKVTVKKAAPKMPEFDPAKIEELVKEQVKAATAPKPAEQKPAEQPKQEPVDDSLTPEERDEVEVFRYLESKDPSKKGIVDKLRKFYKAQEEFLAKKLEEEGEDYNPQQDPDFQKFLKKHAPQVSASERRAAREQKLIEETEKRVLEKTQATSNPRMEQLERELRETRERPAVQQKVGTALHQITEGLPSEIAAFHAKNGYDADKTRAEYPEFDVVNKVLNGFERVASSYMELRRGLAAYDGANPLHQYVSATLNDQANKLLATNNPEYLIREGKRFVHPAKFNPNDQNTWTFTEDDALSIFRYAAKAELNHNIKAEHERAERLMTAKQRRAKPQVDAQKEVTLPEASPKAISATPAPGASSEAAPKRFTVASMLGLE